MRTPPFPDMDELLQRLLDGDTQPEEMKRLQQAIREDPRVRDYYVDSMLACAVIRRSSQVTGELSKSDLVRALSHGGGRIGSKYGLRHFRSIAAVLVLGVLALAALTLCRHRDPGPPLGTLAGAYEAQWRGAQPLPGELLYAGSYDLREGAARMDLGQGTHLLLEAPCQVELKNAGEVTLRNGRLAALVPPQAKGFRVRTRTAVIADLGTAFGVIAHADGSTEAHVLKGRVNVSLDPNRTGRPTSAVVNEHQAVVVDTTGRTIRSGLAARADIFLLQLPSSSQPPVPAPRLNLADIVGGGNGLGTGTLDQGIDLATGLAFQYPGSEVGQSRRNMFRPSPQFRGIDGVFVPNGAAGRVVISSTGLTFADCPRTLGTYFGGPVNSGKFSDYPSQRTFPARLNGISYGTPAHPALNLHPNAGITFDLNQIRQDHPDISIDRFTALCGIPKDAPQPQLSPADVWILLDGVVRLHLRCPVDRSVIEKVDLPISQTRFLTLAATCSGRAYCSWVLLGDPFLEPAAPPPPQAPR